MIDRKKDAEFLGLSSKDRVILEFLSGKSSATVTGISREIDIPRTTVGFVLRGLLKRGLVERVGVGNHKEWRQVDEKKTARRLKEMLGPIETAAGIAGSIKNPDIGIEVYNGKGNVLKMYEQVFQLGRGGREYVLQGNRSVEAQLKKVDKQHLFDFHEKIKRKRIIIEGIVGEKFIATV